MVLVIFGCGRENTEESHPPAAELKGPYLKVLGTAQDAGAPQLGCLKECCQDDYMISNPEPVTSLALVDPQHSRWWLFEATPDISTQTRSISDLGLPPRPEALFLTHAHIGHYTGLMYYGRESFNAGGIPVYTMPRMYDYLSSNGPWNQLVALENIKLHQVLPDSAITFENSLRVVPFPVPHRDEFSETVGYLIQGPNFSAVFIPDIDKWEKWGQKIEELIEHVDYAFLDGTFYGDDELPNRNMAEIPHPFIQESIMRFDALPATERAKIYFIHFNHTNPLLRPDSNAAKTVLEKGYGIARRGDIFPM